MIAEGTLGLGGGAVGSSLTISITWLRELSFVKVRGPLLETVGFRRFGLGQINSIRYSPRPIVVDLRGASFVDVGGLVMLTACVRRAKHQGTNVNVILGTSLARLLDPGRAPRLPRFGNRACRVIDGRPTELRLLAEDAIAARSLIELFGHM
jgi:hypothetical protein